MSFLTVAAMMKIVKKQTIYAEGKLSTTDQLLDIWKGGQRKLNKFWNLWENDYLLSLRERTQTSLKHSKKQSPNIPQVGDVVLIKEDLPCGRWKIGRIQELVKGKDQLRGVRHYSELRTRFGISK